MANRTHRSNRVQPSNKTRSKSTGRRPAPSPFILPAEGPGITDAHRETGALLEKHWAGLSQKELATIVKLVMESLDGGGK